MINPIAAAMKTFSTLVDNEPKSPLHVGEVMSIWIYYTSIHESIQYLKAGLNTTTDDDLIKILKESKKQCESTALKIKNFMVKEGVALPSLPQEKPDSDSNNIPLGVKMTDDEIANGVSLKTAYAVSMCATSASQSVRNDVALMFMEFLAGKAVLGAEFKTLMRQRGWIRVPPYYYPPGMPNSE